LSVTWPTSPCWPDRPRRYRLQKFLRRNRGRVLAASLVLLALMGGIIGTTWGMIRATDAQAVAVNETKQKEAALAASQQSERDARAQLFLALWNRGRAGRFSRQMGQRLDSLAALAEAARLQPDERLRDEVIAALALPDVRRVPGWRSAPPGTATVAYGGKYRLYARAETQGILSIRSIPDDQEIRRIAAGPILREYLCFSPDERFLVALGEGQAMQHCVADYINFCYWRWMSIWSMQLDSGQGPRQSLTVEVDLATRAICQARGRNNRLPRQVEREILEQRARREGLQIA
jgi:hypothetical protein